MRAFGSHAAVCRCSTICLPEAGASKPWEALGPPNSSQSCTCLGSQPQDEAVRAARHRLAAHAVHQPLPDQVCSSLGHSAGSQLAGLCSLPCKGARCMVGCDHAACTEHGRPCTGMRLALTVGLLSTAHLMGVCCLSRRSLVPLSSCTCSSVRGVGSQHTAQYDFCFWASPACSRAVRASAVAPAAACQSLPLQAQFRLIALLLTIHLHLVSQ